MSVVSNIHTITPLTKDSKALSGQRLVRMIAKKTKSGEYESPNLIGSHCVSIPQVDENAVMDAIDKLFPHVLSMIRDTQDKMIREYRVSTGRNEIQDSDISVAKCVEWLDNNATSDRFTTEYLQEWFMSDYAEHAHAFIRKAIDGCSDDVLNAKTNVLRDMFAGYASGRYSPVIPMCKAMIRFTEYVDSIGVMDSKMAMFRDKTVDTLARKEAELSTDALGF